ncbi:ParA family protein [Teichococcus wenyumeiae]|uniref:ParA family protein n=1 Tax=Teichococcus wenyumeiae TaxID=2478470 RepID=UPI0034622478
MAAPSPSIAKILVCSSGKGGSGKTCLTRNLAVFAAHAGLRVATVDLDPQRGLTNWHAVRPEDAVVIPNVAVPLSDLQDAMRQARALGELDLIIVDTPPGVDASPAEMRQLLLMADYVLVPTGQGAGDLRSVTEWMAFIRREQRPSAFVLNLTVRSAGSFDRAKQRLIEAGDLCPFDIRLYESIRVSDEVGLGVAEMKGANGLSDIRGVFTFAMHAIGLKVPADD